MSTQKSLRIQFKNNPNPFVPGSVYIENDLHYMLEVSFLSYFTFGYNQRDLAKSLKNNQFTTG